MGSTSHYLTKNLLSTYLYIYIYFSIIYFFLTLYSLVPIEIMMTYSYIILYIYYYYTFILVSIKIISIHNIINVPTMAQWIEYEVLFAIRFIFFKYFIYASQWRSQDFFSKRDNQFL